jgi:hypothetical protein
LILVIIVKIIDYSWMIDMISKNNFNNCIRLLLKININKDKDKDNK